MNDDKLIINGRNNDFNSTVYRDKLSDIMVYREKGENFAYHSLNLSQEPRLKSHATQRVKQTSKKLNQTI